MCICGCECVSKCVYVDVSVCMCAINQTLISGGMTDVIWLDGL